MYRVLTYNPSMLITDSSSVTSHTSHCGLHLYPAPFFHGLLARITRAHHGAPAPDLLKILLQHRPYIMELHEGAPRVQPQHTPFIVEQNMLVPAMCLLPGPVPSQHLFTVRRN